MGVSNPATWGPVAIHCSFDPPRPVIFKKWGEVFYGPTYAPHDRTEEADARLYRSAENPHPFSITFAFSQGAAKLSVHPHLGAVHPKLLETTARQALPAAVMADRQFCGMMHARMLKWADHYADAVVRFVIFHLLSEYKQCKNIAKEKLPGGNTDPDYCKTGFEVGCMSRLLFFNKFFIVGENTMERGYDSEKLWHALLSDALPIYFGSPSIHDFANPERFVTCTITQEQRAELRTFFQQTSRSKGRKFIF